tara:strand:- start:309 stop:740 length:432 start_codon:yes stop_codon:yes gene_type:complete
MTWIDIDKELEWVTAWDKEDRHVGVISKHECVVDVEWVEELLTQVKRLREELEEAKQKRDKNSGALNIALEHLGYQGADHEQFCKEQYGCNVYGDELIKCDNIECGGFLVNRYGDCISTISLSESAGCEDEDCCNYYKGSEEE